MQYSFRFKSGTEIRSYANSVSEALKKLMDVYPDVILNCNEVYNLSRGSKIPQVYIEHLIKRFYEVSQSKG